MTSLAPQTARMMWILSADDVGDDNFRLDLNVESTPQELTYRCLKLLNPSKQT